jgi:hypothetical protein
VNRFFNKRYACSTFLRPSTLICYRQFRKRCSQIGFLKGESVKDVLILTQFIKTVYRFKYCDDTYKVNKSEQTVNHSQNMSHKCATVKIPWKVCIASCGGVQYLDEYMKSIDPKYGGLHGDSMRSMRNEGGTKMVVIIPFKKVPA